MGLAGWWVGGFGFVVLESQGGSVARWFGVLVGCEVLVGRWLGEFGFGEIRAAGLVSWCPGVLVSWCPGGCPAGVGRWVGEVQAAGRVARQGDRGWRGCRGADRGSPLGTKKARSG